ncbi:MAG: AHH domain-containing protein [Pseudomonadota bacterium]
MLPLIQLFGDRLSWDIDRFIEGDLSYLANSLAREEQAEAEEQIRKSFPDQSTSDVDAALKNDRNAIARMARKAVDKQFSQYKTQVETEVRKAEQVVPNEKRALNDKRDELARVEKTFSDLGFGAEVPETESAKRAQQDRLSKQCFWVLSSVRHNPNGSRIVYGGVHVEPQVNVLPSGSSQHQSTMNSAFSGGNQVDSAYVSRASEQRMASLREQGYQAHHIISDKNERTKDHSLFGLAGESMNSRHNIMYLPKDASLHDTRTVHIGRHRNDVSEAARARMQEAVERGQAENWSQEQYRSALHRMQSEMRQDLRTGYASLNKHERPWATNRRS